MNCLEHYLRPPCLPPEEWLPPPRLPPEKPPDGRLNDELDERLTEEPDDRLGENERLGDELLLDGVPKLRDVLPGLGVLVTVVRVELSRVGRLKLLLSRRLPNPRVPLVGLLS